MGFSRGWAYKGGSTHSPLPPLRKVGVLGPHNRTYFDYVGVAAAAVAVSVQQGCGGPPTIGSVRDLLTDREHE